MNKKILIGSIGIVFILVLVPFTSVVNAQTTKMTINDMISEVQTKKSIDKRLPLLQQIKALDIYDLWDLLTILFGLVLSLIVRFSLNHPPL